MPVSFTVAPHPATPVPFANGRDGYTAQELLKMACSDQHRKLEEMLQFSFPTGSDAGESVNGRDMAARIPNILPNKNGFVNTVIEAYNKHHALVIRPDDVWLAILSQFNFFVNANAELLRANFVAHEGKKELIISSIGTRYSADFAAMSRQMVNLIEKNVVDPTLRHWVMPDFTTTTVNDTTVAAVLMMATLKSYFSYGFSLGCGIPRITLEGERSDWTNILDRLEKLKEYGIQTIAWYHLLRPVITRFVTAFDAPATPDNVDFWQRVAHYENMGSGPTYYSGWINAFNVFNTEGAWLGHHLDMAAASEQAPEALTADEFWATYANSRVRRDLIFDGTPYHRLDTKKVPEGYAEVDVKLDDNGDMFDCIMVAGMVGTGISSSHDIELSPTGADDTVHPVAGWWMFIKKEK
ncbi:hypothetical protein B0H17DRAFT_1071411 [Mycena rosella]|uniref:DUF4419 domain-containing protein n=1 Tax=Mycena rosella TaxID=1033263 RepID=A0AAD7GBH7_MYCRO|nr:hypothetical protein B0H17DRAFT_1071411 [Mycena rosella]